MIEMRDRIKDWHVDVPSTTSNATPLEINLTQSMMSSAKGDALNALVSLGYSQGQADKAIKAIYSNDKSSEDLIRDALKSML